MRISWPRIVPLGAAVLLAACAEIAPPPGGPEDTTPPTLASVEPGSLATGIPADQPLRFTFSEKVERRNFAGTLQLVPELPLRKPEFDGLSVSLRPARDWPADTVVVWTLRGNLKDKHGVALGLPLQGAFTRADSLPSGAIEGTASWTEPESPGGEGTRARGGRGRRARVQAVLRADLYVPAPPDARRGTLWRWAAADETGRFRLEHLERPSGPWELQVYLDRDGNGRRDEREPVASRDSLFLSEGERMLQLGALELVDLEAPVALWACVAADSLPRYVVFEPLQEEEGKARRASLDSTGCTGGLELEPGRYRVGGWIDEDGDGRLSPDSSGISEPYLAPLEWEVLPATPDTLLLPPFDRRLVWTALDTLLVPPVPLDHLQP